MKIIKKLVLFFMVFTVVLQLSAIDIAAKSIAPYPRLSELYFIDITSYPDENYDTGSDDVSEEDYTLINSNWSEQTFAEPVAEDNAFKNSNDDSVS